MVKWEEIESPSWAEHTFQVYVDSTPVLAVGLVATDILFKRLYIGVTNVKNMGLREILAIRRVMEKELSGWTLWCFTFEEETNIRFAKVFGFTETDRDGGSILYERTL